MGNFEIFSQVDRLIASLAALGCLFFCGLFAMREKRIKLSIAFFLIAFLFDFLGGASEFGAIVSFEKGNAIETYVMVEMLMFLLFMIFMSLSSSALIFGKTKNMSLPTWILGSLGAFSIVLFTFIVPDGAIISKMRFVFPLAAFLYFAIGLLSQFTKTNSGGYAMSFVVTLGLISIICSKFFAVNIPWYTTTVAYILYALSFLMIYANEQQERLAKAEQKIESYNHKIEEIIKLSPFPIIISRLGDDKIILANNNAIKLFGIEDDKTEAYHLKDFFADSDNRKLLLEKLEEQSEVQDFEVLIKTPFTETPFWLLASANIIDYNQDIALYSAFQDITSRKSREAMLQNQAIRDPLTSLYNRRYFEEEVKKRIIDAKTKRQSFSVLMIDADFFKKVNDTYGHKTGDKVLIELAAMTEKELRDKDIVARYGGEEFVVFLPEISAEQALKVAERLRQSIASIVVYSDEGEEVRFTVSTGVSSSEISDNVDVLVKTADEALYKAKQNGRNRVEIFTQQDLKNFESQGKKMSKEEKDKIHPIYDKENNAEISLLDGVDAKDIQEPIGK